MKIFKAKPGVILLPVSAVFIIFIILLTLLIDQKKSNNELALEYRANRVIDLLLDLYSDERSIDPSVIDGDIIGFGIYDPQHNVLFRYGTAPEILPVQDRRSVEHMVNRNRSILIIRQAADGSLLQFGMGLQMQRMSPNMMRRLDEQRNDRQDLFSTMMGKYQAGVYLEYANSSYIAERRLISLIIILFILLFGGFFTLLFRLYMTNRRLLVKAEHDRQLIQLGEAARTLAHEIRNPLGALKIQRDLLKKKLPSEYEGSLKTIDRELMRLNVLVERVGEFLRNPVGSPEQLDLVKFLKDLYGDRDNITFADPESVKPVIISFDRDRLRTVADNLVNNAVDSGGSAELSVSEVRGRVRLSVADKGPGFTEEALKRLYDPFFTTKNTGTGLGLSVVKRLVESAGGRVEISNLKTGGAAVEIFFRSE